MHVCSFSEIAWTFFNGNDMGDFKNRERFSHFLGFYPCLWFAGVLKYTLNKYLDQSAANGVEI